MFSDGFGLGIIGIALTGAAPQLGLGPLWTGLLGGGSLLGLFLGALLTGPLADHHGRRPVFAYNMIGLAALSALQMFADGGGTLLALRLAIGVLLGTDYVVSKAMLTEFTPRRYRGKIVGLLSIAWAGGYACAYFVGFALGGQGSAAWHLMLLASAVPCMLVLPFRLTMPESPLWLAGHGRAAAAEAIVRRTWGGGIRPPVVARGGLTRPSRWRQLLAPAWRRHTLVACAFFTCQVIPFFAVGAFVSQLMSALDLHSGYLGGLLYNVSLLCGAILGLLVVDRMPRRRFLIGGFVTAAGAMLTLTLWSPVPPAAMMLLFVVFAVVLQAASSLVYVYLPELFPTDLRATGIGLAIAASRLGSAVSTFLLPVVVAAFGVRTALALCVAVLVTGALICWRWAPETAHLPLEALDRQ